MKLNFFYRLKTPSYLFEFCQEIVLSKNVIISCIQKKTWHARNISFSQHYSRIAPSLFISYALVINLYNVSIVLLSCMCRISFQVFPMVLYTFLEIYDS